MENKSKSVFQKRTRALRVGRAVRFPGAQVEVSRETTLDANSIRLATAREGPREFVLPAAEQPHHQTLSCVVECPAALVNRFLVQCGNALHFNTP